jgi:hypothetical protein
MRRSTNNPARAKRRQMTSEELIGKCLAFLQNKFYHGKDKAFAADRKNLLDWVVLWPAKWLDEKAVTISLDEYYKIFMDTFMDSVRFGDIENLSYPPAWLAKVLQSHFDHQGDKIYERAKSVRTITETAVLHAIRSNNRAPVAPDPIKELVAASRLLKPKNHGKRKPVNDPQKAQLNLL